MGCCAGNQRISLHTHCTCSDSYRHIERRDSPFSSFTSKMSRTLTRSFPPVSGQVQKCGTSSAIIWDPVFVRPEWLARSGLGRSKVLIMIAGHTPSCLIRMHGPLCLGLDTNGEAKERCSERMRVGLRF